MASTEYTDKQLAEHLERFRKDGTLPDGSVFDPAAESRKGGVILRKMTAQERRDAGLPDSPKATDDDKDGRKEG